MKKNYQHIHIIFKVFLFIVVVYKEIVIAPQPPGGGLFAQDI